MKCNDTRLSQFHLTKLHESHSRTPKYLDCCLQLFSTLIPTLLRISQPNHIESKLSVIKLILNCKLIWSEKRLISARRVVWADLQGYRLIKQPLSCFSANIHTEYKLEYKWLILNKDHNIAEYLHILIFLRFQGRNVMDDETNW